MWKLARDEVLIRPRRDIQTAKFLFTVMWNPLGFHVVSKLATDAIMNEKIFPEGRTAHAKRLIIHMENCSTHTSRTREDYMKQNNMMRL
jgi:hypothetical protein